MALPPRLSRDPRRAPSLQRFYRPIRGPAAADFDGAIQRHSGSFFLVEEKGFRRISARGRRIVSHIKGLKTIDLLHGNAWAEKRLALKLHGSQDAHMRFKELEIPGGPE